MTVNTAVSPWLQWEVFTYERTADASNARFHSLARLRHSLFASVTTSTASLKRNEQRCISMLLFYVQKTRWTQKNTQPTYRTKVKTISSLTSAVQSNSGDCIYYFYYDKINDLVKQRSLHFFQVFHYAESRAKTCTEHVWAAKTTKYKHWCQNTPEYSNKEATTHLLLFPKSSPQHLSEWMSNSLQERRVTAETKKWRSTQQMRHTGRGCWLMCTLCMTKLANILKIDQTLGN